MDTCNILHNLVNYCFYYSVDPPCMVPLSGKPNLVVHHEVHCATHIKVREGGESEALC